MFYVINKDRIISVIIALSTVIILFLFASVIKTEEKWAKETSSNIEKNMLITDTEEMWQNNIQDEQNNKK